MTYHCDVIDRCSPVANSQLSKGWLSHVNAKFIPLENGIIQIGECVLNRGQPYFHLQYVTMKDGESITTCLTQGTFEVLEILSYDPVTYNIYFMSTEQPPNDPLFKNDELNGGERANMWSMKIRENKINHSTRLLKRNCQTCRSATRPCQNWRVKSIENGGIFLRDCLGPNVPFVELVVPRTNGSSNVTVIDDNRELARLVDKTRLPQAIYRQWFYEKGPSTPGGYYVRAKILVPPNKHLYKVVLFK